MQRFIMALFVVASVIVSGYHASALTIVRQDGQGGAQTTIAAAIATEPDGGSIEIQQFSGPFYENSLQLSWRSLTSTTATKPTIQFSTNCGLGIAQGTLSKVILKGTGDNVWQKGLTIYQTVTVDNCEIGGFNNRAIDIFSAGTDTCTITNTFVYGPGVNDEGTVAINSDGAVTINHCTIVGNPTIGGGSYALIYVHTNEDGSKPNYTGANIAIKNTILKGGDRSIGAWYTANLQLVHNNNDFLPNWSAIKYNQDANDGVIGPTELLNANPLFINEATHDYHLQSASPCILSGENQSNIGADPVPAPPNVRQDGQGAYRTLAAAIAACPANGTVEIKQWTGPFNEGALSLGNRSLVCNQGHRPTINFSAGTGLTIDTGTVKNVILQGTGDNTLQKGLIANHNVTIDNCEVRGFGTRGIDIYAASGETCTVQNTLVCGVGNMGEGVVAINGQGAVNMGHCTLIGPTTSTFANVYIYTNSGTYNGSNMSFKSCAFKGGDRSIAAYYLTTFAPVHNNNDFVPNWQAIKYNADGGTIAPGATEYTGLDPKFFDEPNRDYTLSGSSPILCVGEDNTRIGYEPVHWWNNFPLIVCSEDLTKNQAQNGTDVGFVSNWTDGTWGTYTQWDSHNDGQTTTFNNAGLKTMSYFEGFGTFQNWLGSKMNNTLDPGDPATHMAVNHWGWQYYDGVSPYFWVGPQGFFDAEAYTETLNRTHPRYSGVQATYPNGTVATGYIGGDWTDPRKSYVTDAIASKDILGTAGYGPGYNPQCNPPNNGTHVGCLNIVQDSTHQWASCLDYCKDSAYPGWSTVYKNTVMQGADGGLDGTWTDNWSCCDSWGQTPVTTAFGEWSWYGFRAYLSSHFTTAQLTAMGVTNVATFDVRAYIKNMVTTWGGNPNNLTDARYNDSRWLNDGVWKAYRIYKRQTGTNALTAMYKAGKAGAKAAGKEDFMIAGNDIPCFNYGYGRDNVDVISCELSTTWHPGWGSRGLMTPPDGRIQPVYKLGREHGKGNFMNVWMYLDAPDDVQRGKPNMGKTMAYEMLANNAMFMDFPGDTGKLGTDASNASVFNFVKTNKANLGVVSRRDVADIGIYYSTATALANFTPAGLYTGVDNQPHQMAFLGFGTAYAALHYTYRLIPEWKLNAQTLSTIRILVIPHSEIFDAADVTIVQNWVNAGGLLIVTGNSGNRKNETGSQNNDTYASLSLSPLTTITTMTGAPARKTNTVGSGMVIFERDNMGMNYYNASTESARSSLRTQFNTDITALLSGRAALTFTPGTSPAIPVTAEINLYKDGPNKKMYVDLSNLNINKSTDVITKTSSSGFNFTIALPTWLQTTMALNVYSDDGGATATFTKPTGSTAKITVKSVSSYACIVMHQ